MHNVLSPPKTALVELILPEIWPSKFDGFFISLITGNFLKSINNSISPQLAAALLAVSTKLVTSWDYSFWHNFHLDFEVQWTKFWESISIVHAPCSYIIIFSIFLRFRPAQCRKMQTKPPVRWLVQFGPGLDVRPAATADQMRG